MGLWGTTVGGVIRVLLADDEVMVRAGVKAILGSASDIEWVAEAGDGREAELGDPDGDES
jgi:DNA-binding NarL/FixJ family response regulator